MRKSRASASVTVCIASDRPGAPAGVTFEQYRRAGVGDRPALAQHRGQRLDVAEAQVHSLARQRMDAVRGVADERETMRDDRRQASTAAAESPPPA